MGYCVSIAHIIRVSTPCASDFVLHEHTVETGNRVCETHLCQWLPVSSIDYNMAISLVAKHGYR